VLAETDIVEVRDELIVVLADLVFEVDPESLRVLDTVDVGVLLSLPL
jgi:hypothetical protein